MKIKARENLDYFPLETDVFSSQLKGKLERVFQNLKEKYDCVIIDGAPSKDSFLSLAGSELADEILVPLCLDVLSVEGIARMMDTSDYSKISYVVPNLFNRRKTEKDIYKQLEEFLRETGIYLSKPFPNSSVEANLAAKGKSIFETEAKTAATIQEGYLSLIEEVIRR